MWSDHMESSVVRVLNSYGCKLAHRLKSHHTRYMSSIRDTQNHISIAVVHFGGKIFFILSNAAQLGRSLHYQAKINLCTNLYASSIADSMPWTIRVDPMRP